MPAIFIKQIPDDIAEAVGLAKYERSRMPGCRDIFQAAINSDGRYVTNIDEYAMGVPEAKREEIKAKRESLERLTGRKLDGLSDFWETFAVTIESDKPKVFNTENPMEYIGYNMVVANRNVAPTHDDAFTEKYKTAQYFAYTEEGATMEEMGERMIRDKAISKLQDIKEQKEKMLLYGQFLEGMRYSGKLTEFTLYKMLRAFIEGKEIKNANAFLEVLTTPVEQIQQKLIIDRAIKQRLIVQNSVGNKKRAYQYGQVTLGATLPDVYKNLSTPDFAPELMAIKNELDNR